ncbi:hypothetical protein EBH_0045860 [Eimeria brunetti]|uniref:SAG family member n=1 Tax=Eimeria brunetti TaxID=51314 RepID=U6LYF0_9EIME|nr:hypothetical protein EBH_0045860 [Eimeria brunetti]
MNSFYRTTAAVCLLAFCGLESEAALNKKCTFTVEEVEEADYIYANFVRNGKLPTHISEVTRDQQLVDSLTQEVQAREATAAEGACETLVKESNFKTMFHHAFEYENDTPPSYSQLLQDALGAGLAVFGEEYFNGLIARTAKLEEMTADDLKAPAEDAAAATAVPTILIAGLVAMLAAGSA